MFMVRALLQKLGRVVEYSNCYQIRDVVEINQEALRQLNNYNVNIRACRDSVSGFEIIVLKNKIDSSVLWIFVAVFLLAVVFVVYGSV